MAKKKIVNTGSIKDEGHQSLIIEKQKWQRMESKGEITEAQLKKELKIINEKINFNIQQYIDTIKKRSAVKNKHIKEDIIKMTEEKTKPKRVTNTSIIIELLQRKGLKSIADVVIKFKEKKPEAVDKNVKQQVTEIIAWVKKGDKNYADYTWDDEAFLLTSKEA